MCTLCSLSFLKSLIFFLTFSFLYALVPCTLHPAFSWLGGSVLAQLQSICTHFIVQEAQVVQMLVIHPCFIFRLPDTTVFELTSAWSCRPDHRQVFYLFMMKMSMFNDCQIALDLGISVGFKKKVALRKTIIEHGGIVSYIVTKKVSCTVCVCLRLFCCCLSLSHESVWFVFFNILEPEQSGGIFST